MNNDKSISIPLYFESHIFLIIARAWKYLGCQFFPLSTNTTVLDLEIYPKSSLPRKFRNVKKTLNFHLQTSVHQLAVSWQEKKDSLFLAERKASESAGMALGRIVYGLLYRGLPYSNFPMEVLIAAKNGATVGDINHSSAFVPAFGKACAEVLVLKKKKFMLTPLKATGRLPPAAFGCDKMTEKRRTGQMVAYATVNPYASDASQIVETNFLANPVVREHDGRGLANSVGECLKMVMDAESIPSQLVAGGMDGQYFSLHFRQGMQELFALKKCFYTHDPAHRFMLSDNDVKKLKVSPNSEVLVHGCLVLVTNTIAEFLKFAKCGKPYEAIIKASENYPGEKFYSLKKMSTTRFAPYFHDVLNTFLPDIKFIIESLESLLLEGNNDQAKRLLQRIANVEFLAYLSGEFHDQVLKSCLR
jgi:hypothetical protein